MKSIKNKIKKNILVGGFLAAIVFMGACQSPTNTNTGNSSTVNHSAMNHNSPPPNSNSLNSNLENSKPTNQNTAVNHGGMPMNSSGDEMPEMMESSPDAANQPYDLQFIDTMIQHHQAAIVMAKMVLEQSQNPELKKFAQKIISDQESEIEQMETWRDAWYPYKLDAVNMELPGMKDSMRMMVGSEMDRMQSAAGREFDEYFFKLMIPHHQGAVIMAKDALSKARHPDLKSLAQDIIRAQEAEIKQMSEWQGGKR